MVKSFSPPPRLTGTDREQLQTLYGYLYRLSGELSTALTGLTEAEKAETENRNSGQSRSAEKERELESRTQALKSLIIKTSRLVESRMDTLETELHGSYVAESNFGSYRQKIDARLTATAESLSQTIRQVSEVSAAGETTADNLEEYITETEGYIRQGVVGYDGEVPIIGIAMGRSVHTTGQNVTVDGKTYEEIATDCSNMSVWTTEKLSFFVNGRETGWFSGDALHVSNVESENAYRLSGKWEIGKSGGFTVKWMGGTNGT